MFPCSKEKRNLVVLFPSGDRKSKYIWHGTEGLESFGFGSSSILTPDHSVCSVVVSHPRPDHFQKEHLGISGG